LDHVLWLGGSSCAGKSAVAEILARRHGVPVYSCDDAFDEHRRRARGAGDAAFLDLAEAPPERLFAPPAAARAAELAAFHRAAFPYLAADLAARSDRPLLVEGCGLLPDLVAAAARPPRAAFLIADDAFRPTVAARRPATAELLARCPDRELARRTWLERDRLFAARVARDARRLGLPVLAVDGSRDLAATADAVADLLGL
ncbi:MAG TPA: hypothetical protein VHM02_13395, partial [Thermoanaerobaculia bacterium]|nr:hypothetical protein [Thermoanaerobaculia bacterium]